MISREPDWQAIIRKDIVNRYYNNSFYGGYYTDVETYLQESAPSFIDMIVTDNAKYKYLNECIISYNSILMTRGI